MTLRRSMLLVGLVACASTESTSEPPEQDLGPVTDASVADALTDAESTPCLDCEYYPETCTADVLCPSGPYDPASPAALDPLTQIRVIRGRSPSDIWAGGAVGTIARFDGTTWQRVDPAEGDTIEALWLRDGSEVAFGTFTRIFSRGVVEAPPEPLPGGWSMQAATPPRPPTSQRVTCGWNAPGSEQLWLTTLDLRRQGSRNSTGLWRMQITPSGTVEAKAAGTSCGDLCTQMMSIHGVSKDVLWAVGMTGSAVRITDANGDAPNIEVLDSRTWNALLGVWAVSESEAWAVGAAGTIRHFTGDTGRWSIVADVPTTEALNAVWGSSASEIWAAGDAGVVLHYDGTRWSRVKIGGLGLRRPKLTAVWVPEPGHVWIGGQGVMISMGGKP